MGVVFLGLWSLLGYFLWSDIYRNVDTAQLLALTEATGRYGVPYSQVAISVLDAVRTWPMEASAVCGDPLAPGPQSYPNGQFSHLEEHAYYFTYLLAPFTWVLPVEVVIAGVQALALAASVLLVFVILRKQGVGLIGSLVFCFVVIAYPVWNQALRVDLYMDRLFPPLALAYTAMLYYSLLQQRVRARVWMWAIPVGLLAASTNDRSMLYVIGITVSMVALMGRRALTEGRRPAAALVGLCVGLVGAFYAYQTWVHATEINTIGGFAARWSDLWDHLRSSETFRWDQTYATITLKFLVVNCVLFGIWGLFRLRFMLVAVGAMLPNLITTLGGAEKITFGFPYHSHYLPVVLFAAALGFARAWHLARVKALDASLCAVALILGLALLTFDPYLPGWQFTLDGLRQSGPDAVWNFYRDVEHSSVMAHRRQMEELAAAVPLVVSVTSLDGLATALYKDRHWFFYPIGLDTAQYAVLARVQNDDAGSTYFAGANSYLGQAKSLDMCLSARLEADGYDIRHPNMVGPYAILKREP